MLFRSNNGSVLRKCSDFYTMLFDIPDLENLKSNELHKFINIDSSYYNYVLILREDLKMKREKLNDMSDVKICDIPEVDNEILFDKIISRYKGCIVLVNFWTTWCVPCRTTLKRVEPFKGLLSDNKEVVFIYITNYTSPIIQWSEMVAGIKGEHYRLNNDQWNYLCKDLEIERIPACILVEKEGDFNIRNDLTSGDDIISEVNFKLEKDRYDRFG